MYPTSQPHASDNLPLAVAAQREQIRWLELRVKDLETQLFGRKSERNRTVPDNNLLLGAILPAATVPVVAQAGAQAAAAAVATGAAAAPAARAPKGPRPLDPALPREVIELPAPELKELICPVTNKPMQQGFIEVLEVLARRPAQY